LLNNNILNNNDKKIPMLTIEKPPLKTFRIDFKFKILNLKSLKKFHLI